MCFLVSNVGGYKEEIVLTIYRLLSFQAISIVNIWESLKQGKFHNYVYSIHTLLLYRVHTPFNKVTIIIKMYQLKAFIWVVTLYYETVKSHRWSGPLHAHHLLLFPHQRNKPKLLTTVLFFLPNAFVIILFLLIFTATIADLLQLGLLMLKPQYIAHPPTQPPLCIAPWKTFHNR